ncbi:MAG TPA: valine--tRNA ligase [Thermoanaerobaculia bacterium]|jgi:valyl-tRNA synthetase
MTDLLKDLEAKWRQRWAEQGTYRFDRTKAREQIYSIDTPPPTVSGSLHPGHMCSYTHTDLIARFQRMRGKEVFYPMGWDDNGLNTERRVQLMLGIACDPSLPYDPDFVPPRTPPDPPLRVSRPNFVACCQQITEMLEQSYFDLWSNLGLSVDWSQSYTTIGDLSRRTSQAGFIDLHERGLAYRTESPTLWDVDFRTAVAQAELQDRKLPGAFSRLRFRRAAGGEPIHIETTRPELLAACVALVAHPDDARYQEIFGSDALTPLFDVRVPIVAHRLADPEKGSGIAMICTFGDTTDITWWRELGLELRGIVEKDGTLTRTPPQGIESARGLAAFGELAGKGLTQARRRSLELLRESGELEGEPKPIEHQVKFWENGARPLEIVINRQWFIRYPEKEVLLELGRQLRWWPEFMRVRYENWVNGLLGDWNITRQRFFGVPFPVWYPIANDGTVLHDQPILADRDALPVDPSASHPPGYTAGQRNVPGGFTADPDVMDTWATSSLSPYIASHWIDDADLHQRVFPMDLRPQAHEIIRTWLFYTIVRSHYASGRLPWSNAAISGFVTDPDRKKLSKSAGNAADDPPHLIAEFGADAVRYWAAGGRPGQDVIFDRNQLRVGRRLATKILNFSKFVLGLPAPAAPAKPSLALDQSMLAGLRGVVAEATAAFENYDYTKALETIEPFFWNLCDNYLELVKVRAYEGDGSAIASLRFALSTALRLFAPFLPFVTEEVWSWWQEGSVHRAAWPSAAELDGLLEPAVGAGILDTAAAVLGAIRKAKTQARLPLRAELPQVTVTGDQGHLNALEEARRDLMSAGNVKSLLLKEGGGLAIDIGAEVTA